MCYSLFRFLMSLHYCFLLPFYQVLCGRTLQSNGTFFADSSCPEQLTSRAIWNSFSEEFCLEERFPVVREWLEECRLQHPECRPKHGSHPRRLLDIGNSEELSVLRLVYTDSLIDDELLYLTLSHCWGNADSMPIKTTTSNEQVHLKGLDTATLPQTFCDAVIITKHLGFRYLWIDALCIIQDSQSDWQTESANMASIYQGSSLTIAASSSSNSDGGCFLVM